MAFDENLCARIRKLLSGREGVTEKRMFGGMAFLLRDHMFCGIVGSDLMVRVGPAAFSKALAEPNARPMDFTGKPMKGYVYVSAKGTASSQGLSRWVERGVAFAGTLPDKSPSKRA